MKLTEFSLKKLFNAHSKTGIEFYFSESGSIPVNIKISVKRLMYWWHILHVDKSEMIRKVYTAQKMSPVSGDWIKMLEKDKELFQINLTDDEVETILKNRFKSFVKRKSEDLTIGFLSKLQRKNSKSKGLEVSELSVSPYLLDSRFTKENRELLFKLRSKTVWVKENFRKAYLNNNMLCELCLLFPCTQSHPLQCPQLNTKMVVDQSVNLNDTDIYGTVEQQLLYVKIYDQFWQLREETLEKMKNTTI